MSNTTGNRAGWDPSQKSFWARRHGCAGEIKLGGRPVMVKNRAISNQPRPLYVHGYPDSSSFLSDTSNDEGNILEGSPRGIAASQPGGRIPKSRTFSVISSITQSFSHGSIARQRTSRNVSGEPHNTDVNLQPVPRNTRSPKTQQESTYTAPETPTLPPGQSSNIEAVSTAMPPQYWAGRFMALHDRFHNELLEPHQLTRICETQAAHPLADFTRPASAATQNNPSTSAYAITRSTANQTSPSRQPSRSRIPQSATSGAILQSTPYNTQPDLPSNLHTASTLSPVHKPTTTTTYRHRHHHYHHLPTTDENSIPSHPPTTTTTTTTTAPAPEKTKPTHAANAPNRVVTTHLADDDEARVRRVLLRLEYMCTTDAARVSLRQWQARYARRTGRGEFWPASSGEGSGAGDGDGGGGGFGRRGREMVRRLKRSLVGGSGADKLEDGERETVGTGQGNGASRANGGSGEGYLADLESLAIDEKEKGRKGVRKFNFF
ncbi:hypothetical protein B0I37DRAFT_393186 [Chaetomium sp. MPI-CAGE-AT-0009]|nr:hypothetical protein B0I37DRAFT_393186 [Chaetomium sp. MPI-CAGE-AT-0009]